MKQSIVVGVFGIVTLCLAQLVAVDAMIRMPALFGDNMVLQRAPRSARIWGM